MLYAVYKYVYPLHLLPWHNSIFYFWGKANKRLKMYTPDVFTGTRYDIRVCIADSSLRYTRTRLVSDWSLVYQLNLGGNISAFRCKLLYFMS